jgi:DNA-binding transcriptional regulator YdaS (Cro superfamily)
MTRNRDAFAPERLSEEAVRERLRQALKAAGGQRAFARLHGFSAAYVNDVLHGRRYPAENICAALGVTRRTVYTVEYKVNPKRNQRP